MKCSNLITTGEGLKNNSGFYLLAIIIVLFIIIMIIFCIKGYNNLENKIDEVISNKFKSENNDQKNNNNNKTKTLIHEVLNINKKKKKARNSTKKRNKNIKSFSKNTKNSLMRDNSEVIKKSSVIKSSILVNTNIENENEKEDEFLKNANDYELNSLPYELAFKYDKRDFCEYYFSLIRTKQLIFFSFCDFNDYNSRIIKKFIFFYHLLYTIQ